MWPRGAGQVYRGEDDDDDDDDDVSMMDSMNLIIQEKKVEVSVCTAAED